MRSRLRRDCRWACSALRAGVGRRSSPQNGLMDVQSGKPRRVRVRDLGLVVGTGEVGPTNTIVDVSGVRVGHTTVSDGRSTFSGATAVVVDGVSPLTPTT